ncbi:MAG: hypothetical protein J6Y74_03400, partial [Clostridia bacterium]|nr:hypothetical protein [Clostridia bacterium]
MTKNLHTKIFLILLVCFTLALLAFACTPKTVTVLPDESSGGSGGGDTPVVDVVGGEKTDIAIGDFFSYLGDAIKTDDESDQLAFDLVSKEMTVVESGRTFKMYVDLSCKYDRRDDDKTELLFEVRSFDTRAVVFGLYYLKGVFYLNVPNEDGGVTLYFDDISFGDIAKVASDAVSSIKSSIGDVMATEISALNNETVGELVTDLTKNAFKSVTKTTKGDDTQLVLKTDFNKMMKFLMTTLNIAKPILNNNYHVDSMLSSVFGITMTNITNYTFENITADLIVNIRSGKLVSMDVDLGYGVDKFALDMTVDNQYIGNNPAGMRDIVFPEFTDYERFSIMNIALGFEVAFENASKKTVTVDNLVGGMLKRYFGVSDLGDFGASKLTLGEGTIGLYVELNAEMSWNKNDRNYIELRIYNDKSRESSDLIGTAYYVGSKNSLYVDLSYLGLPKFVYKGLNLASVLKTFVVSAAADMFGTAESDSAESLEMRELIVEAFGDPGDDYDTAMRKVVTNGVYELSAAEGETPEVTLSVIDIIDKVVSTIEKRPEGRKSVRVTADREILFSLVGSARASAKETLEKAEKNKADDQTLKDLEKALSDAETAKEAADAALVDLQRRIDVETDPFEKLDLNKQLPNVKKVAEEALSDYEKALAAYDACEGNLDKAIDSAENKYRLFDSLYSAVSKVYSTTDLAIRSLSVELGIADGFGIFLDAQIKLADDDTYLHVKVDPLLIGYTPVFVVPKADFDTSGYSSLEEFSTVSLSAMLTLSGDTGSMKSRNLGNALGNAIAELNAILGVENRLSGGVDVTLDANLIFEPINVASYFGGSNASLNLSNIELAIQVYKKPDADTVALTDENRLLSLYYGEYAAGESAIFIDASALSLSQSGNGLPKMMYKIRLEDLFSELASAETEVPAVQEVSAADAMSSEELFSVLGGFIGGVTLDNELSVILADRLISTLIDLLAGLDNGRTVFGRLFNATDPDTVLKLDNSSENPGKVYLSTADGFKIGATIVFDTSAGETSSTVDLNEYVNPSVKVLVSDISAGLFRKDVIPASVKSGAGTTYRELNTLESVYVEFEADLEYTFRDMEYSLSDFAHLLATDERMPVGIAELLLASDLRLDVNEPIDGHFKARVGANIGFANGFEVNAKIELLREADGVEKKLADLYYDGIYLYVDAEGLSNTSGDGGLYGLNLPKFKIKVNDLPCGCGCSSCLEEGACDGMNCGTGCKCKHCVSGASAEEEEDSLATVRSIIDLLDAVNLTDRGLMIALESYSLDTLLQILKVGSFGDTLPDLTPSFRLYFKDGVELGMHVSYKTSTTDYVDITIGKFGVSFEPGSVSPKKEEYGLLSLNEPGKIAAELSGRVYLELEASNEKLTTLVQSFVDGVKFGVQAKEKVVYDLSFDLKVNANMADFDLDSEDPDILAAVLRSEVYFALYNDVSATQRELMLMLYADGKGMVYARAPWLGIGPVSYRFSDLIAEVSAASADAVSAAEEDAFSVGLAKLIFDQEGFAVSLTGAAVTNILQMLFGLDQVKDMKLDELLTSVEAGIGLNDGISVNLGAIFDGAKIRASVTGMGVGIDQTLDLPQYIYRDGLDQSHFVELSTDDDGNRPFLSNVSAGIAVTMDLTTGDFHYDASSMVGSIASLFDNESVTNIFEQVRTYLVTEGNMGELLKAPVTLRLDVNADLNDLTYLQFTFTVTGKEGGKDVDLLYIGYDYAYDAAEKKGQDTVYIDLALLGTPKFKVENADIVSKLGLSDAIGQVKGLLPAAAESEETLECGCACPECVAQGYCTKATCKQGCDCECHTLIGLLNSVIANVYFAKEGVIGVVTTANSLAVVTALLGLDIILPEGVIFDAKVDLAKIAVELGVSTEDHTNHFGVGVSGLTVAFAPRDILKNKADFTDWSELTVGFAVSADLDMVLDGLYATTLSEF